MLSFLDGYISRISNLKQRSILVLKFFRPFPPGSGGYHNQYYSNQYYNQYYNYGGWGAQGWGQGYGQGYGGYGGYRGYGGYGAPGVEGYGQEQQDAEVCIVLLTSFSSQSVSVILWTISNLKRVCDSIAMYSM